MLALKKQTAPSAATNYNKLFTKTNGDLAWIDENGVEHLVGDTVGGATLGTNVFNGPQTSIPGILTSTGGFTPLDLSISNSYVMLLAENTVLQNPINIPAGFDGVNILIIQDATTPYTVTLDTDYLTLDGTPIVVSTTLSAENILTLQTTTGTKIWASLATGGQA